MLKSNKNHAYIIAEIGQNHQGKIELAEQYIRDFSFKGADAIKFQKRDMKSLFSEKKLQENYNSENAFARTYGKHREYLEFNIEEMAYLKGICDEVDVDFMCTAFDNVSLNELINIDCNFIKLASFDMGNLNLIEKALDTGKKVVLSSGGSNLQILNLTYDYFKDHKNIYSLLYCVSKYPCTENELDINQINNYKNLFPKCQIGLSDHFSGPLSGPVGLCSGAEIFEKHVTFNRSWKGTDHSFALSPTGFEKFVKDINRAGSMLSAEIDNSELGDEPVFKKLGKTLVAAKSIKTSEDFNTKNLTGKITTDGSGLPVRNMVYIIDQKATRDYKKGDIIDEIIG